MNDKIAILITTFLRDTLLYKTLQTIIDYFPKNNCIVLVVDQGYRSDDKEIQIDYFKSQIELEYYNIPFDSGLSYARNFLVQKAYEMQIPYCLMSADSIQFTQTYDFRPIINILQTDNEIGRIGFDLLNSKCSWEYILNVTPEGIKFSYSNEWIKVDERKYLRVDICRNIFLATTQSLIDVPYDVELKLGEHEDQAIRYKTKYLTYWTDSYVFKKIISRNNDEYNTYRKRLQDYLKLVKQKYNLTNWIIYPKKRE